MAHNAVPTTPLRTLALDPGTREMGYAVLESTDLLYFGVHTFPHRCSARRLCAEGQRFVEGLIDGYAPQLFVIEKTWYAKSKRSSRLHVFVEAMEGVAARQGLIVWIEWNLDRRHAVDPRLVVRALRNANVGDRRTLEQRDLRVDHQ